MNKDLLDAVRALALNEVLCVGVAWPTPEQISALYADFDKHNLTVNITHDHGSHELRIRRVK